MARKIKRGLFKNRFFCSKCNHRADKEDSVCQNCGAEFEEFIEGEKGRIRNVFKRIKRAVSGKRKKPVGDEMHEQIAAAARKGGHAKKVPEETEEDFGEVDEPQEEETEEDYIEEEPAPKKPLPKRRQPAEEEPEEAQEEEFEEFEEAMPMPSTKRSALFLPKLKTVLWVLVIGMLLWGLFAEDTMFIVAAVLVIIVAELESIRKKLG